MPSRRSTLSLTAGAIASLAGCAGTLPGSNRKAARPSADGESRGEAKPITTEQTVDGNDATYVPSNDTVRYPASSSGGEVDEYRYLAFENWAYSRAAFAAAEAVRQRLTERLENTDLVSVLTSATDDGGLRITVVHTTEVDESGTVVASPDVSVDQLVDQTPRSVTATVHFAGHSATHEYPVLVVATTDEPGL